MIRPFFPQEKLREVIMWTCPTCNFEIEDGKSCGCCGKLPQQNAPIVPKPDAGASKITELRGEPSPTHFTGLAGGDSFNSRHGDC